MRKVAFNLAFSLAFVLAFFELSSFALAACPTTTLTFKDASAVTQTLCFGGASGAYVPQYQILDSGGTNILGVNASGQITIANSSFTANAGTNLNTSALATSANQTNASQKTQIVDGSGNVIGSTSNALNVAITSGGGSGGTSSSFGTTFPATGTAIGVSNGTNMLALTLGQATLSASVPVAIASNQGVLEVSPTTAANTVSNPFFESLNTTPSLANGNGIVPTQGGSVLSATNGIYSNLLQGNAVLTAANPVFANLSIAGASVSATNGEYANLLQGNAVISATNGLYANILQGNAVLGATNPIFSELSDATHINTIKAASTASAATDTSLVVQINPNQPNLTTALNVALAANQSVNLAQVNAVTTLTGAGATGTGAQRVTASQDTTTIAGSAPGTAGTPSAQVLSVQGVTSMTPILANPGTASNWGIVPAATSTTSLNGQPAMAASTTSPPNLTTAQTNFLSQDLNGNLRTNGLSACNKVINVTQTATTDVHTFTGFGYICSIVLVSATAQNIGIDEGTGTTCETSGTALIATSSTSAATPQMALAANGGFSFSSGLRTQASADHLCVLQSSTGEVAGTITYADLTN